MTANRAVWTRLCISDLRYLQYQHQQGDETDRERERERFLSPKEEVADGFVCECFFEQKSSKLTVMVGLKFQCLHKTKQQ